MKTWGIAESSKLYNIDNWGNPYFSVNATGNIAVTPKQGEGPGVDLMKIVEDVRARGIRTPVLIRFQDLLRNRVVSLNEAFRKVITEAGYQGKYQGVYPVKVNQMREVVEEIIDAGRPYDYGLEAGSKGELAIVVSMDLTPNSLIICNGYKDYDFIKTALMGIKLGKRVIIVVEKLSELYQVISVSKELGVTPQIGIRSKLYSKGSGRWEGSSGDQAKFGLTTPELLHAINVLKQEKLESSLKLMHFHIGSQVSNISTIKSAVKEGTRIYAKVRKMGFDIEFLDVGGGLGVDYDGSRTNFDSSMNYTINEYVADVVYSVQEVCSAEEVPEPNIVSESGRAIVAHHSVLVVGVFGNIEIGATPFSFEESEDEADVVKEMRYLAANLTNKNLLEHYHDANQRREEALTMFNLGILSLEDRGKVDYLYWQVCRAIHKNASGNKYVPEEIEGLNQGLADQYLCNFSVFQSMLDHWAIQHLFPIVPIHRLNEEPTHQATLADITCDSDGKVHRFIDLRDIKHTLPLHPIKESEPYYLGFFMMGAYQDIMGDLHNLFSRVNEVHVFLDETEPNGYYIEEVIRGHHISEVLSWIQYSSHYLEKRVKDQIDQRVREGLIKPREGVEFQDFYENLLHGYTYIDTEKPRTPVTGAVSQSNAADYLQKVNYENPQPRL